MGAIGMILDFLSLGVAITAVVYVHHLRRAMQRAAGAGLERAEHMVGAVIAASRADAERIVAAVDALAASSPWRRPPPPPVTMAHQDRVERPPEHAADTWPDMPEPPADRGSARYDAGPRRERHRAKARAPRTSSSPSSSA